MKVKAFAVVPNGEDGLCWTNAPDILGGGDIYQIYTTKAEAQTFCEQVKFSDATYRVVEVWIAD